MDAMAVSICQGMAMKHNRLGQSLLIAGFFGGFQALMPVIGFFIGNSISLIFLSFNRFIAFLILLLIGGKMIIEAVKHKNSCENLNSQLKIKSLTLLAVATSIDALAVGISLAMLKTNLLFSVTVIGIITFFLSLSGIFLGYKFKHSLKAGSEIIGGITLILIGLKIAIF